MEKLKQPTLVVFCGWPSSGKTAVAEKIKVILNANGSPIRHFDIDEDVRTPHFGKPTPNDGTDSAIDAQDKNEMGGSYRILMGLVDGYLKAGRSILITATFSNKKWGQDVLAGVCGQHPHANVRIIWCNPTLTDEELAARIAEKVWSGYTGATTSVARIRELQKRFDPIKLQGSIAINSGPPNTVNMSVEEALDYILSPQPHDTPLPATAQA